MTLGDTNFTNFPENQLNTFLQAPLSQEVARWRPALKISTWMPWPSSHTLSTGVK